LRRYSRGTYCRSDAGDRVNGSLYASARAKRRRDDINSTLVIDEKTVIALLALLASGTSLAATPWQKITQPVSGSPQSIGAFANGCIVGAQALPLNATGYQVMRTDQNRYFGHPDLVQFIQRLSNQAHNKGMGTVLIGDMGMPAGDALTAATPAISPDWTSIFSSAAAGALEFSSAAEAAGAGPGGPRRQARSAVAMEPANQPAD
jgi:hypothetical protein